MIKADLPAYIAGKLIPTPQPTEGVSVTKLIEKTDGEIHWDTATAEEIFGKIRAFTPWPGAYTFLNDGKRLLITKAHLSSGKTLRVQDLKPEGLRSEKKVLVIDRVKVEGKPEMDWQAFLAGYRSRLPAAMQTCLEG